MGREPQKCKQCGREIYFDGICADCRAENQKKEILALTEEEIAIRIKEICEEIETTGDLDKNRGMFIKLLDYRDINTAKIAETAFKNKVFYPCELYKDAPNEVVKSMIEMIKQDDIESGLAGHLLLCLAAAGGDEVYNFLASISDYIITSDVVLNDGETIGFSEEQKIQISVSEGIALDGETVKLGF